LRKKYSWPLELEVLPSDFSDILRESDRGAALLSSCYLEDFLDYGFHILVKANNLSNDEVEAVFSPLGPVGTLAAKIRLARLVGLIRPQTAKDMDLVREIRDRAAHVGQKFQLTDHVDALKKHSHYARSVGKNIWIRAVLAQAVGYSAIECRMDAYKFLLRSGQQFDGTTSRALVLLDTDWESLNKEEQSIVKSALRDAQQRLKNLQQTGSDRGSQP
jgi:hypothetical protein